MDDVRPAASGDADGMGRAVRPEALLPCMRCGFCLPTCPTYALTGRERSSPRGRLALARAVSEGRLAFTDAVRDEAFFCLDCRACATVCPSGVSAGEAMERVRGLARERRPPRGVGGWLGRFVLEHMLPSPRAMETSMLPARLYQWMGLQWAVRHSGMMNLGPGWMQKAEAMLPRLAPPLRKRLPEHVPAEGRPRGRVGFFLGCVMNLMYPEISRQTVRILAQQGFEVITPPSTRCCGAPHLNEGDRATARSLARFNRDLFLAAGVDWVVTDCAGCGAALKATPEDEVDGPEREGMERFAGRVRDVTEFLAEQGLRTEGWREVRVRATYHEPCHLCHAQGVSAQPRALLRSIPGLELREMKEASWCCGSAATWGLSYRPESKALLDRKLRHVRDTGAEFLATANPGCHLQLAWGARAGGLKAEVVHVVELLGRALPPDRVGPATGSMTPGGGERILGGVKGADL